MSVFEYLGVLLSVIIGLGVTHLLAGLSKTIHFRKTIRLYWVHTLWTFNVLIFIVIIWWGMFWWSGLEDWSFFNFLLLTLYAIVLFLLASLLYPWELTTDFDFEMHFQDTRPWFFAVLALAWLIDMPETVLKSDGGMRDLPQAYVLMVATQLVMATIGAIWPNRSFHGFYAVFWPIFTVGYVSVTTLVEIAN
jgi:hypothetical protein